jgi:hypothetical protein
MHCQRAISVSAYPAEHCEPPQRNRPQVGDACELPSVVGAERGAPPEPTEAPPGLGHGRRYASHAAIAASGGDKKLLGNGGPLAIVAKQS